MSQHSLDFTFRDAGRIKFVMRIILRVAMPFVQQLLCFVGWRGGDLGYFPAAFSQVAGDYLQSLVRHFHFAGAKAQHHVSAVF